ncbi:TIGR03619 family F420-dependent LLM class oxidoreductase [Nocardiopsis sp. MG754419]|uniref:TIGR03619 family F420-dependent LLM class oxidoreductase n=1 Tax=Nocardiopsis sp. MG754419 TaxID=2259865 RepID=UPI001BA4930A|nr:TIGR03619 family F420-dependent LLM class oxidoreductase [Nocardiopsis sp. MG754419]MBR8744106.1 LLM class F420-dependent oxidoreductase [Nocardiopsis sp. MG754419]
MSELTEPLTGARLQVVLPDESPDMPVSHLVDVGVRAEELGVDTVWLPDHVLPPKPHGTTFGGVYEPLVTLSYLAARTRRVRLGTSVLVLPLRDPFVTAKQAATLDRLSGGRFTLGVGVGWSREEFAALGSDFRTRGARTDEALALMRHLFEGEGPFRGRFHSYEQGYFEPRPARRIPVTVGGGSDAALRRAAEWADEWQGLDPDPEAFRASRDRLRGLTDRPVRAGVRMAWTGGEEAFGAAVENFRALTASGADAVAVWFGEAEGFAERMLRFVAALR